MRRHVSSVAALADTGPEPRSARRCVAITSNVMTRTLKTSRPTTPKDRTNGTEATLSTATVIQRFVHAYREMERMDAEESERAGEPI